MTSPPAGIGSIPAGGMLPVGAVSEADRRQGDDSAPAAGPMAMEALEDGTRQAAADLASLWLIVRLLFRVGLWPECRY